MRNHCHITNLSILWAWQLVIDVKIEEQKESSSRGEWLQKPLMNYDTSIILIGNKSGQGENKERRICASLRGERERTKAAANHSDSQIGQHWNRQGKAASELEQATMLASLSLLPHPLAAALAWQIFHQTCAHVKRQIGVVAEDSWTHRRTLGKCCELWRGRAQVDPSNCSNPLLSALD